MECGSPAYCAGLPLFPSKPCLRPPSAIQQSTMSRFRFGEDAMAGAWLPPNKTQAWLAHSKAAVYSLICTLIAERSTLPHSPIGFRRWMLNIRCSMFIPQSPPFPQTRSASWRTSLHRTRRTHCSMEGHACSRTTGCGAPSCPFFVGRRTLIAERSALPKSPERDPPAGGHPSTVMNWIWRRPVCRRTCAR